MGSSERWKREMSTADSADKLEIIEQILKLGDSERKEFGIPALIVALQADDEKVRSSAAFALAEIAPDSQVALHQIVRCMDQEFAAAETTSLGLWPFANFLKCAGLGVEPVFPSLMRYLRHFNEWKARHWFEESRT